MYTGLKSSLAALVLVLAFLMPARAETYQTRVKVIHASKGTAHVDPGIQGIVREIRPVFNYTSFKMVKEKSMSLSEGQKGRLSLPGKRALVISPEGRQGDRLKYHIRINANGRPVFQTRVMLKNNSSVTIGGPKFKKGALLFNIGGRAR